MTLLIVILKDEALVRKVVGALVEMELFDSTVLDGEAIENLAMRTIPLFEDVGRWFGQNLGYNRTILAALRDRSEADTFVELCRRDGIDLADPAVASLVLLPCERYVPPARDPEAR
jgi:hypothetical protein